MKIFNEFINGKEYITTREKRVEDYNIKQEIYSRIFNNHVYEFFQKIKHMPNVLTLNDIDFERNKFFSFSVWKKQFFELHGWVKNEEEPLVFGLKSGICFSNIFIYFLQGNGRKWEVKMETMLNLEYKGYLKIEGNKAFSYGVDNNQIIPQEDLDILNEFISNYEKLIKNFETEYKNELKNQMLIEEKKEKIKQGYLQKRKIAISKTFDKDNNGEVDLIENDFNKLLNRNQKKIIEIDKNYIHQFVKVSNYIKTKKANVQYIYKSIEETSNMSGLDERSNLLKNQIHTYELLVLHSINMIGALAKEDLITFYEIYESFDKIGIFNSNWENEVSEKLTNIGNNLADLMYSIYNMEQNIVSELSHLSYVTQESFEDLNRSVTSQLKEVESSINTNNLLTGIQAYQLYKINKNTKGLRS